MVAGSWSQQGTGLRTLKTPLLSNGRWEGAWWINLPGRRDSRTRWWHQTLMEKGKSTLPSSSPPFCSYSILLPCSWDTWHAYLFASSANLDSHLIGLSLIITTPQPIIHYKFVEKLSHPCWSLGYSLASGLQPTLQPKLWDPDKLGTCWKNPNSRCTFILGHFLKHIWHPQ